jgi:hypothetical protein
VVRWPWYATASGDREVRQALSGSARERALALVMGVATGLLCLELGLRIAGTIAYPTPESSAAGAAPPGTEDLPVVLCVGDSHTAGLGQSAWPARLDRLLNPPGAPPRARVINAGLGGANTALILAALPAWLEAAQPDVVVLEAGTSNHTNYLGYADFLGSGSPLRRLDELLYHLRVYRLIRYVSVAHALPGPLNPEVSTRVARMGAYEDWATSEIAGIEVGPFDPSPGGGPAGDGSRDLAEAHRWLALCAEVAPDGEACRALERKLAEASQQGLHDAFRPHREQAGRHQQEAMSLADSGRYLAAIEQVEDCISADPMWVECYGSLGKLQLDVERAARFREHVASFTGSSPLAAGFTDAWRALDEQEDWQREAGILSWVASDLAAMLDLCAARAIPVILHSYPVPDVVNPVMQDLAAERGLAWVDHVSTLQGAIASGAKHQALLSPDSHCTLEGNELVARDINAALDDGGYLEDRGETPSASPGRDPAEPWPRAAAETPRPSAR